ncbi:acyl-CoA dehydrogenase family protein [Acinetobacter rathckeae]|uniref:acyl-CoA dehydrogenase family protein n=1 Tax=Acinetobacter rathckeae TaxID=2605272 RepID=UPI0018A289EF|nr:acyl-CoA dehydrogenase family protein [Acinetobacter rathckeae]MBF7688855.1 monooxygenase [Acinetobacter rathckeae]MBF7696431.1 monooxygenase [Acinetobacter rathckeae]
MTNLNHEFKLIDLYKNTDKHSLIGQLWGNPPSARYEALAKNFRPVFEKIKQGALLREQQHILPHEQLQWLKQVGFTRLRLPKAYHGFEATIPELFALLVELAEADANLPQILRVHFGFSEELLLSKDTTFQKKWLHRLANNEVVGSGWSEGGSESQQQFQTHIYKDERGRLKVSGKKYYTTGSLFADWVDVGVTDLQGKSASVLVSRHHEGVSIVDDWNGFGQQLTASGSAIFHAVEIDASDVLPDAIRFKYSAAYYQLVQLAIIVGLGRGLTQQLSQTVQQRTRNYSHANANYSRDDAQVLQVVGKVRGATYTAGIIVEKSAEALQRAFIAGLATSLQAEAEQNAIVELETAQAQTVVTDLLLNASTIAFDALGASAIDKKHGLDRYWRNIRTLSSHNPRIYKDRIVGDFSVNGHLPPYQWRIGNIESLKAS